MFQVYLEPGEAIVTQTTDLVVTVLDVIENEVATTIVDSATATHRLDTLIYNEPAQVREATAAARMSTSSGVARAWPPRPSVPRFLSASRRGRPAAHPRLVLVVLHIPRHAPSAPPGILDRSGRCPRCETNAHVRRARRSLSTTRHSKRSHGPASDARPSSLLVRRVPCHVASRPGNACISCTPTSMPKDHLV